MPRWALACCSAAGRCCLPAGAEPGREKGGRTGEPEDERTAERRTAGGWLLAGCWLLPRWAAERCWTPALVGWWPMARWRRCGGVRRPGVDRATERVAQRLSQVASSWWTRSRTLGFALLGPLENWLGRASSRLGSVASHDIRLGSGSFRLASRAEPARARAGSRASSYFSSPSNEHASNIGAIGGPNVSNPDNPVGGGRQRL